MPSLPPSSSSSPSSQLFSLAPDTNHHQEVPNPGSFFHFQNKNKLSRLAFFFYAADLRRLLRRRRRGKLCIFLMDSFCDRSLSLSFCLTFERDFSLSWVWVRRAARGFSRLRRPFRIRSRLLSVPASRSCGHSGFRNTHTRFSMCVCARVSS